MHHNNSPFLDLLIFEISASLAWYYWYCYIFWSYTLYMFSPKTSILAETRSSLSSILRGRCGYKGRVQVGSFWTCGFCDVLRMSGGAMPFMVPSWALWRRDRFVLWLTHCDRLTGHATLCQGFHCYLACQMMELLLAQKTGGKIHHTMCTHHHL